MTAGAFPWDQRGSERAHVDPRPPALSYHAARRRAKTLTPRHGKRNGGVRWGIIPMARRDFISLTDLATMLSGHCGVCGTVCLFGCTDGILNSREVIAKRRPHDRDSALSSHPFLESGDRSTHAKSILETHTRVLNLEEHLENLGSRSFGSDSPNRASSRRFDLME